mmetsp:Transcript_15595/g.19977  ORF Transcript_15595/g.19977 Transcript_15595/m.19977 type:complete len:283 (+) Transcript_15595:24-872(+)
MPQKRKTKAPILEGLNYDGGQQEDLDILNLVKKIFAIVSTLEKSNEDLRKEVELLKERVNEAEAKASKSESKPEKISPQQNDEQYITPKSKVSVPKKKEEAKQSQNALKEAKVNRMSTTKTEKQTRKQDNAILNPSTKLEKEQEDANTKEDTAVVKKEKAPPRSAKKIRDRSKFVVTEELHDPPPATKTSGIDLPFGTPVNVHWERDGKQYPGTIQSVQRTRGNAICYEVMYDDGSFESNVESERVQVREIDKATSGRTRRASAAGISTDDTGRSKRLRRSM